MALAKNMLVAIAVAAVAALAAGGCYADNSKNKLNIGDAAPVWSDLPGTDDQKHSLADYKDVKLLVLVFTTNHCPVARAYEDRLIALERDYRPKGAKVVAVNVNNHRRGPLGGHEEAGGGQRL